MKYNIRKFHYQDGIQIRVYKIPVETGKKKGAEAEEEKVRETQEKQETQKTEEKENDRSKEVSMNRSKQMIYGIARANEWQYFLTLTFDRNKVDSSDYSLVTKKSCIWLENIRRRTSPDIKYLIVPELHSDGIHWHMHGLMADCPELTLLDSDYKTPSGLPIYNLQNWRYGFSTVTKVTHNHKVSAYISKYITKEMAFTLKGRQRYWCSNNVIRPMQICEHDFIPESSNEMVEEYSEHAKYISSRVASRCYQQITYIEVDKDGK